MSKNKDLIYGMARYYLALMRFRLSEYGWVKAHWHFLLAHEYLSKTNSKYLYRCVKYLILIDERNRARELELKKEETGMHPLVWKDQVRYQAGIRRRIRKFVDKHDGDLSDINLAMLLTCPDSLLTKSKGNNK